MSRQLTNTAAGHDAHMRSLIWPLALGLALAASVGAQPCAPGHSCIPHDELMFLMKTCELNPEAIVPRRSGSPRLGPLLPLCGNGHIKGLINGEQNAFSVWKKPKQYRQWSLESGDPCRNNWRGVYCNAAGRLTSLSLAEHSLRELPDPSALVYLESLNIAGNLELLASGALPVQLWSMPRLTQLCLSPIGPLDCTKQENGHETYELAVKGERPDPYGVPQSLCVGMSCPAANLNHRIPSILPARVP